MIRKTVIVALVLAVAGTICLWADSYEQHSPSWWGGHFYHMRGRRLVFAVDQSHSAMVGWTEGYVAIVYAEVAPPADGTELHFNQGLARIWNSAASKPHTCFGSKPVTNLWQYSWLAFPVWIPLASFAAYPTFAFVRGPLRRWRRRRKDSCVRCGYDLQGNESGVCPECGTEVRTTRAALTRGENSK